MLPLGKIEEIKKLLAEGSLSQRKISALTGVSRGVISQIALGERPNYKELDAQRQRETHYEAQVRPTGEIERCPSCGARVYAPCRLCHLRKFQETANVGRYRRRAKQKAVQRLLAAVIRREEVKQAEADELRSLPVSPDPAKAQCTTPPPAA